MRHAGALGWVLWAAVAAAGDASAAPIKTGAFDRTELRLLEMAPGFYELDAASVELRPVEEDPPRPQSMPLPLPDGAAAAAFDWSRMIVAGEKVWQVVEKNRPVVETSTRSVSVLPGGAAGWRDLSGWRPPQARTYEFAAKNLYGIEVLRVRYQVSFLYGGRAGGKGRYLADVRAVPLRLDVAWGYRFSLGVELGDPVNAGSPDDPVAAVPLRLHWKVATALKESQGAGSYYVQGDGAFQEVGSPWALH